MINTLLVAATIKAFEDILASRDIPFEVRDDEETRFFRKVWDESDNRELALRQARPAIERIAYKEPYLFRTDGEPLSIRLNYLNRRLDVDSFGEILLERPDLDWRFTISVKNNAHVLASLPVADRDTDVERGKVVTVFNEIDDFGDRIFGVPCSNDYFTDVNEILMKIEPLDRDTWDRLLNDKEFALDNLVSPMLNAMSRELPRICKDHPEAPQKLLDYFYGNIDYYYINPIDELEITRIGAVNPHGGLGRIPGNHNRFTPKVEFPTQILDIRFATGRYGELSRDTIQITFDGGWTVRLKMKIEDSIESGRLFTIHVYMPVTPFGSYRDQVAWDPKA